MVSADFVWMNGEFVAFEDAKVPVLTHALHYGTGVFEGVRCYETPRGPGGLPPRRSHRPAVPVGRAVLHGDPVLQGRDPRGDERDDPAQQLPLLLHPPAGLPRRRPDGPVPAQLAGRGRDRGVGVGQLPRRRGQAERRARARSRAGGASRRLADPGGQGLRPVPQLRAGQDRGRQGRLRGGHPARPARHGLRGHGREPVHRQGRQDRHAGLRQRDPRRHQPPRRRSRSPATSATRSRSATSPAASSTWPTRSS